ICTNVGSDVPGHAEAGLTIVALPSDNALFSGQVDPASPAQPLPAGQSVVIDVSYVPMTIPATPDVGTLTIVSNAPTWTSTPQVVLSGSAINEPTCHYSVMPLNLNFGVVGPGTTSPSGFTITNLGPNECIVSGLGLSADTQNAFVLSSGPVI